jgi:hypothetical protein
MEEEELCVDGDLEADPNDGVLEKSSKRGT